MIRRSQRIQGRNKEKGGTQIQKMTVSEAPESTNSRKRAREDEKEEKEEENAKEYDEDTDVVVQKRRKKTPKQAAPSKLTVASPSKDDQYSESSTRRQRMPEHFRKVRGRFGLLERLAKDVPLDVILEIFCYLDPWDLLRLARTSRDLRNLLMSKSSESTWRIARDNIEGLPPRPEDLNEPQYAHLLFEPYCHICRHSGRCETVLWKFRIRACKKCTLATFPSTRNPQYIDNLPLAFRRTIILPEERIEQSSRTIDFLANREITDRYKAEYEALQTEYDRNAWIVRKKEANAILMKHSHLCEQWHRARLDDRADELNDIRSRRKEAILDRLEEIGWRDEAEMIMTGCNDTFSDHKLVKQSKKLTDYGWRTIKDELVKLLSAEKRRRILSSRYDYIKEDYLGFRSQADFREPFPRLGDILMAKVIQAVITDTSKNPTEYLFRSKVMERLPGVIDKWKAAKTREIVRIMQKARPTATVDDLHLATSVFECRSCGIYDPMYYPQMFSHMCCVKSYSLPKLMKDEHLPHHIEYSWTSTVIAFSEARSEIAKTIIQACSLDPTTATSVDMYAADPLVECLTCKRGSPESSRFFMRWPTSIIHNVEHPLSINSFSEEEREKIVACRSEIRLPLLCAHCHNHQLTDDLSTVLAHLKEVHSEAIDATELENCMKLADIRKHWYFSPFSALKYVSVPFRYEEILPPMPSDVALIKSD